MIRARNASPLLLAGLFAVVPLAAENLAQNPQFDASLAGWSNYGTTPFWVEDDRYDSPTSGAMGIIAGGDIPVGAGQCVAVPGDGVYQLAVDHVRAIGSSTAWAWATVSWYSDASCEIFLGSNFVNTETASGWQRLSAQWTAPTGSNSAQIRIYSQDTGAGPELHFDDVYFGVPVIFEDGFESGDTSRWPASP